MSLDPRLLRRPLPARALDSLDRWTTSTQAPIYPSWLWEGFIAHFCKAGKTVGRVIGIPDAGLRIRLGRGELLALPADFMHAQGNRVPA